MTDTPITTPTPVLIATGPQIPTRTTMGRPRALDEVKLGQICSLVSTGCTLKKAARYVGCAASTIRREARRNHDFGQQLRRASMASELEALRAIQRAAGTHWRAAAWLLNRAPTDDLLSKHRSTHRVAALKTRPVEISELERFASALQTMVVQIVPDNTTMYRLHHRINELLAAARSKSPTAGDTACTTDASPNQNPDDLAAADALPLLASDSKESTSTEYQPNA